jgi:hypothetical protein
MNPSFFALRAERDYAPLFPVFPRPTIASSGRTDIEVLVNDVLGAGAVHCAAFEAESLLDLSTQAIKDNGVSKDMYDPETSALSLRLTDLFPETDYLVYCYSEDFKGHKMPLDASKPGKPSVKGTKVVTSTAGPRMVHLVVPPGEVPVYDATTTLLGNEPVFKVTLDARPSGNDLVKIDLSLKACDIRDAWMERFQKVLPSNVMFDKSLTSPLEHSFRVQAAYQGCFYVHANQSSISDFSSLYKGSRRKIRVRAQGPQPNPPAPERVQFADDGQSFSVHFDTPTDHAGYSAPFPCSEVVSFTDADLATCIWSSDSSLQARLHVGSTLAVGDGVQILSRKIQSQCIITTNLLGHEIRSRNCGYKFYVLTAIVFIDAPDNAMQPVVGLSTPSAVSSCGAIHVDPTSSYGNGGRDWIGVAWEVEVEPSFFGWTRAAVDDFLNTNHVNSTQAPLVLPNELLQPGSKLRIGLRLTNFLGQVGFVQTAVDVSSSAGTPEVTILGPSTMDMFRHQELDLFAAAKVSPCAQDLPISYIWRVFEGFKYVPIQSVSSKDPRTFKLAAYSLRPHNTYTVQVTASVGGSESSTTVTVHVLGSPVVADITGGDERRVSYQDNVLVDGSKSYDMDYPELGYLGVTFSWSCSQIYPNFGVPCTYPEIFETADRKLQIPAGIFGANEPEIYNVSLSVSNANNTGATAATFVKISFLQPKLPTVTANVEDVRKVNPQQRLVVTGLVKAADGAAHVAWSCNDLESEALAALASSEVVLEIVGGSTEPQEVSLVFAAGVLSEGSSYTFVLSSFYLGNNIKVKSTATVSVVTNSPPKGGIISVTPDSGEALITLFNINTYKWLDAPEDMPLRYTMYSYVASRNDQALIKVTSVVQTHKTYLPQGNVYTFNRVTLVVRVEDQLGSFAELEHYVEVSQPPDDGQVAGHISQLLSRASATFDTELTLQVLGAATAYVNTASCDNLDAGLCRTWNREYCSTTKDTCGSCLSGYFGTAGHANAPCKLLPEEDDDDRRRLANLGRDADPCSSDDDCLSYTCDTEIYRCQAGFKKCPGGEIGACSGHGVCITEAADGTQEGGETCAIQDPSCYTLCECDTGFYGADCSLSRQLYDDNRDMRAELCESLYNTLAMQDISIDVIASRSQSVLSILQSPTHVKTETLDACMRALTESILEDPVAASQDSAFYPALRALARLLEARDPSAQLIDAVWASIYAIVGARQDMLGVGEEPSSIVTDTMRIAIGKVLISNVEGHIVVPSSTLESIYDAPEVRATFVVDSMGHVAGATVLQFHRLHQAASMNSSSVLVEARVPGTAGASVLTRVRLSNQDQTAGVVYYANPPYRSSFMCYPNSDRPYEVNITCPSEGFIFSHICPGEGVGGALNYSCPSTEKVPECFTFDSSTGDYSQAENCRVVDVSPFDPFSTTCECDLPLLPSNDVRSELVFSAELASASRIYPTGDYSKDPFTATVPESEPSSAASISTSLLGLITAGMLMFIFVDSGRHKAKMKVLKKKQKEKEKKAAKARKALLGLDAGPSLVTTAGSVDSVTAVPVEEPSIQEMFTKAFPDEFTETAWWQRWANCMEREHVALHLVHSREDSLSITWAKFGTRMLNVLVVCSIVMDQLGELDDDVCQMHLTETDCNAKRTLDTVGSGFFETTQLCEWNDDPSAPLQRYCSFKSSDLSFLSLFGLAIVVSVVAVPLDKIAEWLFARVHRFISRRAAMLLGHGPKKTKKKRKKGSGYDTARVVAGDEEAMAGSKYLENNDDTASDEDGTDVDDSRANTPAPASLIKPIGEMTEDEMWSSDGAQKPSAIMQELLRRSEEEDARRVATAELEAERVRIESIDSLHKYESTAGRILRAAAFTKMAHRMDSQTALIETRLAYRIAERKQEPWQTVERACVFRRVPFLRTLELTARKLASAFNGAGDPAVSTNVMLDGMTGSNRIAVQQVASARRVANSMVATMSTMHADEQKEEYLIRHLVFRYLADYRLRIAQRFLLDWREGDNTLPVVVEYVYYGVCTAGLVTLLIGEVVVLAMMGEHIGAASYSRWLMASILAVCYDLIVLQPYKILWTWIFMSSLAHGEVMRLRKVFEMRIRYLAGRTTGVMRNTNALVQHFHPACRAARQFPALAVSRVLLTLNDYDLRGNVFRTAKKPKSPNDDEDDSDEEEEEEDEQDEQGFFIGLIKGFLFAAVLVTVSLYSRLPYIVQDLVSDELVVVFISIALYTGAAMGGLLPMAILGVLLLPLVGLLFVQYGAAVLDVVLLVGEKLQAVGDKVVGMTAGPPSEEEEEGLAKDFFADDMDNAIRSFDDGGLEMGAVEPEYDEFGVEIMQDGFDIRGGTPAAEGVPRAGGAGDMTVQDLEGSEEEVPRTMTPLGFVRPARATIQGAGVPADASGGVAPLVLKPGVRATLIDKSSSSPPTSGVRSTLIAQAAAAVAAPDVLQNTRRVKSMVKAGRRGKVDTYVNVQSKNATLKRGTVVPTLVEEDEDEDEDEYDGQPQAITPEPSMRLEDVREEQLGKSTDDDGHQSERASLPSLESGEERKRREYRREKKRHKREKKAKKREKRRKERERKRREERHEDYSDDSDEEYYGRAVRTRSDSNRHDRHRSGDRHDDRGRYGRERGSDRDRDQDRDRDRDRDRGRPDRSRDRDSRERGGYRLRDAGGDDRGEHRRPRRADTEDEDGTATDTSRGSARGGSAGARDAHGAGRRVVAEDSGLSGADARIPRVTEEDSADLSSADEADGPEVPPVVRAPTPQQSMSSAVSKPLTPVPPEPVLQSHMMSPESPEMLQVGMPTELDSPMASMSLDLTEPSGSFAGSFAPTRPASRSRTLPEQSPVPEGHEPGAALVASAAAHEPIGDFPSWHVKSFGDLPAPGEGGRAGLGPADMDMDDMEVIHMENPSRASASTPGFAPQFKSDSLVLGRGPPSRGAMTSIDPKLGGTMGMSVNATDSMFTTDSAVSYGTAEEKAEKEKLHFPGWHDAKG